MFKSLILLYLIFVNTAFGTTFVPISIKNMSKEATGVIYGRINSIHSEQLEDGMIATYVNIFPEKWTGVDKEEEFFQVYSPGGKFEGKGLKVEGAPEYEVGEMVFVFVKYIDGKLWVNNLGLGKFSEKKIGRTKVLINQIFPSHPKWGQIPTKKLISILEKMREESFKTRFKDKFEIIREKKAKKVVSKRKISKRGRSIASVEEREENESNGSSPIWPLLILAFLCGSQVLKNRKLKK